MRRSVLGYLGALLVGSAAWFVDKDVTTWMELLQPQNAFALLGALGSVTTAWVLQSPRRGGKI